MGSSRRLASCSPAGMGGAVHRARLRVLLVGLAGQVAAHDALELEHVGPPHQDGPSGPLGRQRRPAQRVGDGHRVGRQRLPGTTSAMASHQKLVMAVEHAALVRDRLGHDHVERAHPVRGHHEEAVRRRRRRARAPCPSGPGAGRSSWCGVARSQRGQGVGEAVDVAQRAGEVEGASSCGRPASPPGRPRARRGRGGAPPRPAGRRAGRSGRPRRGSARRTPAPAGRTGRRPARAWPR